jgi:DNA processing protein
VRGQVEKIMRPQIALVGARHSSPGGRETAEVLAYSLAEAGYVVTSGLAAGIDAACHRGALAGFASTVAVMGTGFQHIYPASNRHLAEKIINAGALVTEFLPGTPPKAKNFPRRNRIISGLSLGVVVIEAALKSGSLITARLAAEQGREVFALPGSIHNPLARGCHALIRQGAKLVETAQDIVEELGALTGAMMQLPVQTKPRGDDKIDRFQRELLASIGYEPTAVDTIIMRSGLTAGEVSSMLLSLELRGYVDFVTGGYVRTSVNSP